MCDKMIERIIYAPWISKKMSVRFDNLEFRVGKNGFLYSLKSYNGEWDYYTKVLWLRSVGMTPTNIAKKFGSNISTLENRGFLGLLTLDYPGKNYKVRIPDHDDWSDRGYVDIRGDRHTHAGGVPQITDDDNEIYARLEMDGENLQVHHDSSEIEPNKPKDPYKEYYGDYEDERTNTATDPE